MSYFPEDIPFMSKEELRENGIRIPKDIPNTNTGNTINLQAAINAVHNNYDEILDFTSTGRTIADSIEDILSELPLAQSERKKGEWIPHKSVFGGLSEKVYTCNQCGYNIGFHIENFCPHCGADMRGK